jgi:hypothetical protein
MNGALNPNIATALYYTFSTIAQALAATMALLAAFAMYRLKALDDEARDVAQLAQDQTGGGSSVRAQLIKSDWPSVIAAIDERVKAVPGGRNDIIPLKSRIAQLATIILWVKVALWVSLALTGLVTAGSVAILATVPQVTSNDCATALLQTGVVATVICLLAYGWLLRQAFRRAA